MARPTETAAAAHTPPTPEEKFRICAEQRALREADLMAGSLHFRSRPRSLEVQFSTLCNMSCTMCHDGDNPPTVQMSPELLAILERELLPTANVVAPFAGSEPLLLTWDVTRELAARHGVELDIITNAQFLDEQRFAELEPLCTTLTISVDSHIREIYEGIRLRSKPDKVFANLPRAARECLEHGIEPQANVVFMTENAATLDDTVRFLADQGITTVRVLEFVLPGGAKPGREFSDPRRHLSAAWMEWKIGQMFEAAREKKIRLIVDGRDWRQEDHRPAGLELRHDRKPDHSIWNELQYFYPGYCPQVADRLKLNANGAVYPCCVVDGDSLRLGNVLEQEFEDVWNGPNARELRRRMLTGEDMPLACVDCANHVGRFPPEQDSLPFADVVETQLGLTDVARTLDLAGPEHHARLEAPAELAWSAADGPVARYVVGLAAGGVHGLSEHRLEVAGGETRCVVPHDVWEQLVPNMACWWTVWAIGADGSARRARTVRAFRRHVALPPVEGHDLRG